MSATFDRCANGRQAILLWHRKIRPTRDKCGAKRKRDGEPCQQIALANGRCHVHGGRTPKGAGWHKPVWPNRDAPDVEQKLARKVRDQGRAAKKRAKRLAAMSHEERDRHEAWQASHRPGSPSRRAERRRSLKQAAESKALMERPARLDPASEEIQREIDELKRRAAIIQFDIFD